MSASLSESYTPQWLYLREFMDALGSTDENEMKDAVLLLIRDRLVFDGKIDERHFRFLAGKPQIDDATWLAELAHEDIAWGDSCIRARPADPLALQPQWFLIEIATAALSLFGHTSKTKVKPTRTPPEQIRASAALRDLFGDSVPTRGEMTDGYLLKMLNDHIGNKGRPITKDTLARATGRRNKRN
jgi:hypothetical protein